MFQPQYATLIMM